MRKIRFQIFFWTALYLNLNAQQSAADKAIDLAYVKAVELFNNQEYKASQAFLRKIPVTNQNSNLQANTAYYLAQTAIRLNQDNAEQLMLSFIEKHPTHPKRNSAYFEVGNYYFEIGKYANTRKWYQNVEVNNLSTADKATYFFNLGYALYSFKRYAEAEHNFEQAKHSEKYRDESNYYLGFISYKADDYQKADVYFEGIKKETKLSKKLAYYEADKNFKQGKFNGAIEAAQEKLLSATALEKSELNKIIGESYFNLKLYKKAIPYLEAYKGKKGKWSNTDHYLLGYAYYKTGNFNGAVSRFNKIIEGKNGVAQNAYYHLADSYLHLELKTQALNAFKNAYEMPFQNEIKKDAGYNYAKLSYEIGNSYESVPSILRSYLVKYPVNDNREELSGLLVDSYVSSQNYKAALEILEIDKQNKDDTIYQKVLYLYGLELYKTNKFKQAIANFKKAQEVKVNQLVIQNAIFWEAESYYQLGEYQKAISSYKQIDPKLSNKVLKLKQYQLGYAYFKLKNYEEAVIAFESFLETAPLKNYQLDAILRLADSYFVLAKYWSAIEAYDKAITLKHPKSDYAHYQKAISYGFVQRNSKKIKGLEQFLRNYTQSSYKDDTLFALANVYVAEGKTKQGIATYRRLQEELPNSELVSKAILKEGLIYYNNDQSNKAIERFKLVAEKYPKTAEALQAVKTARLVYIDMGKINEYANWVNTLDFVEITNEDLDNTTYEAAEKQYFGNNNEKAILNFETYLKRFSNGLHSLEAHFYLGQLYTKVGNSSKALPHYIEVTQQEKNEFTETALYKAAQIHLAQKSYDKALPFLEELEKVADFQQNVIFAKTNLMKAYNEVQQYEKTLIYAENILKDDQIAKAIKTDAQINKARAAFALKRWEVAQKSYTQVAKTATGEVGAEALYYLAKFDTENKKYAKSNVKVQQLAKKYSSYRVYGAKGLVLMGQNFYGLEDAYQATYVLNSLIKNFKEYPQEVKEAQVLLKKIKAEQAKVNSSVNE